MWAYCGLIYVLNIVLECCSSSPKWWDHFEYKQIWFLALSRIVHYTQSNISVSKVENTFLVLKHYKISKNLLYDYIIAKKWHGIPWVGPEWRYGGQEALDGIVNGEPKPPGDTIVGKPARNINVQPDIDAANTITAFFLVYFTLRWCIPWHRRDVINDRRSWNWIKSALLFCSWEDICRGECENRWPTIVTAATTRCWGQCGWLRDH